MEQPSTFSNRIPVLDLSREIRELKPQLMQAAQDVLDGGAFIMGDNVRQLEREIAGYLGVNYAVALNSGTDALVIALLAAGIGEGDEVITTPFTFFATAEAISRVNAVPVFADVEPDTFNLNPDRLKEAITPRTKAIIPVHLFGQPADMDRLMELAQAHGLHVIEDAAQAFGADHQGRKAGTIGDIGCFSFFPSKNLGAFGDGGMLVTNSGDIAEQATMLRAHGSKKKYYNELIGLNSRLDEIQAAFLRVKLPYIEKWNEDRRQAARVYRELLGQVSGLKCPVETERARHVFHQYTVRVMDGRRDELKSALDQAGIGTAVYYPLPVHKLPVYEAMQAHMPVAEQLSGEVLSLPIGPHMEAETQAYIARKIVEALR
ncbi:DegT/DnrJ/EryC1/StrS family aminotransferase [Paenibacillus caui]|uniref:DegT/DnrJ/EryC1/StrS family aminotransferase n=1 Tax=Paenibacillus caui TaxID=2873927 RepID=UPI001CA92EAE|nr:DegT/DnrJ/EryC1/StrS family aminotransferase [Paenibacillus caui]